jgi:hypothetical protein
MTRARLGNPKWVFWACAGFVLPILNPPLVLFTGGAAVVFGPLIDFVVLWFISQRVWSDPRDRKAGLFWGMLVVIACSFVAAFGEFWVALWIAAQNCPPDAYECPI